MKFKIKNPKIKIAALLIILYSVFLQSAFASETNGTITGGGNAGHAWSNQTGWVNFGCSNCGISITDSGITGYAWNNNYGWINMSPANGGVSVSADGALSGYAWGSGLGWINFSGVSINSSGKFVGAASGTTVGTLTFDCANCSVTTDFRAQNFRIVAPTPIPTPTPTTVVSSGGGGGGGGIPYVSGPGGQSVPAHISAFDAPMKLFPAQSGTLTQNLANQKSVILDSPSAVYSDDITFIIREEAVSSDIAAPDVSVIGNSLFDVTAWDRANNPVRSFLKSVKITLTIPELLRGRADLGAYFFDDATSAWVNIPDAVFSGDEVSFYVDHLTLFGIFASPSLPPIFEFTIPLPEQPSFETPPTEVIPTGIQPRGEELEITTGAIPPGIQPPPGEEPEVIAEEIPPAEITLAETETLAGEPEENSPLFDIEVSPGPAESKKISAFVVLAVLIIAVAGAGFYIFRRKRKNQQ